MPDEAGPKLPDAVSVALLLLPGFITIRVSEYYATGSKLSEAETIASALGFTLVTLVSSLLLWRMRERLCGRAHLPLGDMVQRTTFLGLIVAVSIGLGFLWAWVDAHDWGYKLSPTPRVSRQPIWQYLLDKNASRSEARFVKVMLKDGTVYFGPPTRYSRSEEAERLYLEPAARIEGPAGEPSKDASVARQSKKPAPVHPAHCDLVTGGVFIREDAWEVIEFYLISKAEKKAKDYCELLLEQMKAGKKAGASDSKGTPDGVSAPTARSAKPRT